MIINLQNIIHKLSQLTVEYKIKGNFDNSKTLTFSSVKSITENGVYFLTKEYFDIVNQISNSIIITDCNLDPKFNNCYIVVENPQLVHYKLTADFESLLEAFIHPTAIIDPLAEISEDVYIGPFCIIGKAKIHNGVRLLHHVTIADNTEICKNVTIEGNSTIGARGMAWIWDEKGERVMQSQLGGVRIGENCLLGTDITIVRGSLNENTIIGNDTIIAHGTKIGHGCNIGNKVHFANNVSLAGNAQIKDRAFLGSGSVVSSNVTIQEGCIVGAGAVVNKTYNEKNCTLVGVPAKILKSSNFEHKPNGAPKPYKKS